MTEIRCIEVRNEHSNFKVLYLDAFEHGAGRDLLQGLARMPDVALIDAEGGSA